MNCTDLSVNQGRNSFQDFFLQSFPYFPFPSFPFLSPLFPILEEVPKIQLRNLENVNSSSSERERFCCHRTRSLGFKYTKMRSPGSKLISVEVAMTTPVITVKSAETLASFKRKLKTYLFNISF